MQDIVFRDRGSIGARVRMRALTFAHTLIEYDRTAPSERVERLRGARMAVVNKLDLVAAVLAAGRA